MERVERDTVLIALALVPVAFMVFVVYQWHSSGAFPMWLFAWAVPNVSLPSAPAVLIPPSVVVWWNRFTSNDVAIGASLCAGLVGGIVSIGTLADGVRALSRVLHRTDAARDPEGMELQFPESAPSETYLVG